MNDLMKKTLLNCLMYVAILVGIYFLYNPLNKHAENKPRSSFSFVYAQF